MRGARFKFFASDAPGSLRPTSCPNKGCDSQDSLEHMQGCLGLSVLPEIPEFLSDYLVALVKAAEVANPGYPIRREVDGEIMLDSLSASPREEFSFHEC